MKTIALNNGLNMPALGPGTWNADPGVVGRAVDKAVRAGYRHIDCAWIFEGAPYALANLWDE